LKKRSKHISNPKYFQNPISSILVYSGFSHLTLIDRFPGSGSDWVPLSKNLVVLSGIVEIALGLLLIDNIKF
jgi:uncharacterized membrane protein